MQRLPTTVVDDIPGPGLSCRDTLDLRPGGGCSYYDPFGSDPDRRMAKISARLFSAAGQALRDGDKDRAVELLDLSAAAIRES